MNRREINNVVVSLAGLLAQTNRAADEEIEQLRAEVVQLRAALGQREAVVKAARTVAAADVGDAKREDVERLREALRGCP